MAIVNNHCALCGRLTLNPAVLIGSMPVGQKCAKKAGLLKLSERKGGNVFAVVKKRKPKLDDKQLEIDFLSDK